MECIRNSCFNSPLFPQNAAAGLLCIAAVSGIALSLIGLIATDPGMFSSIVQWGTTTHASLLSASAVLLTLDALWLLHLCGMLPTCPSDPEEEIPIIEEDVPVFKPPETTLLTSTQPIPSLQQEPLARTVLPETQTVIPPQNETPVQQSVTTLLQPPLLNLIPFIPLQTVDSQNLTQPTALPTTKLTATKSVEPPKQTLTPTQNKDPIQSSGKTLLNPIKPVSRTCLPPVQPATKDVKPLNQKVIPTQNKAPVQNSETALIKPVIPLRTEQSKSPQAVLSTQTDTIAPQVFPTCNLYKPLDSNDFPHVSAYKSWSPQPRLQSVKKIEPLPSSKIQEPAHQIEIKSVLYFDVLPEEIMLEICDHLSKKDLKKCYLVRNDWRSCIATALCDVTKLFNNVTEFDEDDWQNYVDLSAYGLSVDDAPPRDRTKLFSEITQLLSVPSEKAGATVLTIPKNLNLTILQKIFSDQVNWLAQIKFEFYNDLKPHLDTPALKTYRIVVSNGSLQRWEELSATSHFNQLKEKNCEGVSALECLVACSTPLIIYNFEVFRSKWKLRNVCELSLTQWKSIRSDKDFMQLFYDEYKYPLLKLGLDSYELINGHNNLVDSKWNLVCSNMSTLCPDTINQKFILIHKEMLYTARDNECAFSFFLFNEEEIKSWSTGAVFKKHL